MTSSSMVSISIAVLVAQILGAILYGTAGVLLLQVRKGEKRGGIYRIVGVLCLLYAIATVGVIIIPMIGFMFGVNIFW